MNVFIFCDLFFYFIFLIFFYPVLQAKMVLLMQLKRAKIMPDFVHR